MSSANAQQPPVLQIPLASSVLQQQQQQQQHKHNQINPSLQAQPTPPTPQSSFTPPSTRPRQLLHNVINTPPPSQSQTQLHLQQIQRPPSPVSTQTPMPTPSPALTPAHGVPPELSPAPAPAPAPIPVPVPPPPPPSISTIVLNKPTPPLPPAQLPSFSPSTYYPPVPYTKDTVFPVPSPTTERDNSATGLRGNLSSMSFGSSESHGPAEWTMDRVSHWLRTKPHHAYLEPIFVEHQICGKAFVGLSQPALKALDLNSSYYQRRKLLLEIKDAVEGTKTAASVSSIGPDSIHTPPSSSASPVLNRLGSGSRPFGVVVSPGPSSQSSFGTSFNSSNASINAGINLSVSQSFPIESNTVRNSFDQLYRCAAEETPQQSSTTPTPMAIHPSSTSTSAPPRPSIDTLDSSEDSTDYFLQPNKHSNSSRPMSDPDLRQLSARLPALVTIETAEYNLHPNDMIPSIAPRQSSMAYSVTNLRPNLNVPPQIVPRMSSREYSTSHSFNSHHSLIDSMAAQKSGRPIYDSDSGRSTRSSSHSDATVVGGTLGFGRRPSHKRNHSSADVIQHTSIPAAPPKARSIQVTLDNENFRYVDVTGIDNAVMLKESIFSRMKILAEKNKYGIFETTELGSPMEDIANKGPPLTEQQLLNLVSKTDNKGSVKFLVTPIMPLILPPDMDILHPKRHPGTSTPLQPHSAAPHHYVPQGRNSPFQPSVANQDSSGYHHHHHHQRERTVESVQHAYHQDPYMTFVQAPDDVCSVHPHQPYPDSKHPHNTGRQQGNNQPMNGSPYGSYQQQVYRYVDNPAHPHFQADDNRRPSIGTNSARTSPRFGPVNNSALGWLHNNGNNIINKPGTNSPALDNSMNHSPLSGKRMLARNPNLSLVIGSNTDQDGKLFNHPLRANDRSASPGGPQGYRQQRQDSHSPNANYYEMNRTNHPGFGEVPMVASYNFGNINSSGLPASPLSAGAAKRSSFQNVKYNSSHSNLNSPRSVDGGPSADMHAMDTEEGDDESENFWGERPPLDFLLENFGRFFQDHDLDHPIIELCPPTPYGGSPMVPAQAILGSGGSTNGSSNAFKSQSPALVDGWGSSSTMASTNGSSSPRAYSSNRSSTMNKKSIRIVAQEAKDRFSRQYSGSKVVRRKSTKMWGSRLAEVMPTIQTTSSVSLGMQEYDEELSPIAGSPAVVKRSSIAGFVEKTAQEHHILPEEPILQEPSAIVTISQEESVVTPSSSEPKVVRVESGKVLDQSQQGIYQHPQSGTIKTFQYLKGGLIGRGSFGKVYHAFNLDTCEMIAIKQVDLPQTLSERNCDRLKTSVEALFSEMEVLKDLDHENIVQYLGFAQNEETANIFLEYVSGGSIESCLKRSGPFPEAVIRSFTRQILLGLEYIHSKKIVHRDIKAANVLVDEQGICKISDFGISKKNAQSQGGYDENVGSLQGSIFWMAPEMVTSKAYGAKVDIWSFGCLVLEMFTGQQPWKGYAPHQALFTIGSNNAHPPIPDAISEEGQRFLARCFISDANMRPTATELLQDDFAVPPVHFNFVDYIE
ncbi:hypothetical protein BG004_004501, partial [Podila humilis]